MIFGAKRLISMTPTGIGGFAGVDMNVPLRARTARRPTSSQAAGSAGATDVLWLLRPDTPPARYVADATSSGASQVHKDHQRQEGPMTLLSAITEKVVAWRRYREAVRELSQFSDHELADIGITRSDIARVASRGRRGT
jgi:uncharacterized protein YjiS (DUF1127 family)